MTLMGETRAHSQPANVTLTFTRTGTPQDLAEGEEPNSETNDRILNMLRVTRADTEARRRREAAKKAGSGVRPPPPYNDRYCGAPCHNVQYHNHRSRRR